MRLFSLTSSILSVACAFALVSGGSLYAADSLQTEVEEIIAHRNAAVDTADKTALRLLLDKFTRVRSESNKLYIAKVIVQIDPDASKDALNLVADDMRKTGATLKSMQTYPLEVPAAPEVKMTVEEKKPAAEPVVAAVKPIPEMLASRAKALAEVVKTGKYTHKDWEKLEAPVWNVAASCDAKMDPDSQYLVVPDPSSRIAIHNVGKPVGVNYKVSYIGTSKDKNVIDYLIATRLSQVQFIADNAIVMGDSDLSVGDNVCRVVVEGTLQVKLFKIK